MTQYQMIEISNQQSFRDSPHMPLTPRIECTTDRTYTSLSDFEAVLTATDSPSEIAFDARGRLLTAAQQPLPEGNVQYHLVYRITNSAVEILASATAPGPPHAPLRFILPVVSRSGESVKHSDLRAVQITKRSGRLIVHTDAVDGFEPVLEERTFNLVPGFECIPLAITMQPGREIRIRLEVQREPAQVQ
jgi:hypothetical protein